MGVERVGTASWMGSVARGAGELSVASGSLTAPYSVGSRTEADPGTNPEELIGAAHAGCFTMSLANHLTRSGHPPAELRTIATVHLERGSDGYVIPAIDLEVRGRVYGVGEGAFRDLAEKAKTACTVSRALAAVEIRLHALLVDG
jgi:lipoyl-dependent peroxiredoxin